MTPIARHVIDASFDALPVPAAGAHGVGEREDPAESLDDARLAAHDRPPLRRMIANLEEAAIDRDVVPVHVEYDDVARGDPNDRIPSATPQRVRAGGTDTRPAFHL